MTLPCVGIKPKDSLPGSVIMLNIPNEIKVAHLIINVEEISQLEADSLGCDGLFSYRQAQMKINTEQHKSQVIETLLHECLHAIWAVAAVNNRDEEEDAVTRIAPLLTALMLDNPDLLRIITDNIYEEVHDVSQQKRQTNCKIDSRLGVESSVQGKHESD